MAKKPLCVAILWHMHQPDYQDPRTGEIILPWTRFHAIKDYYDMAATAAEIPQMSLTINMVPTLLDQLGHYAGGRATETCMSLSLREPNQLDERERAFLLKTFFQLPWKQMILPYPRYRELHDRRGPEDPTGTYSAAVKRFSAQDYRDLQVWYNLSWCGDCLRKDPAVAGLLRKGRGFNEADKEVLFERQLAFIGTILPLYRSLAEERRIELSASPYYHPILPLLCDGRSAREALPGISLPSSSFAHPADARRQIDSAVRRFAEEFGQPPRGMWPSEGALSAESLSVAAAAEIQWLASDEAVLANSLRESGIRLKDAPARQYRTYRWGERGPCLFFRDHELSDLVGFIYSRWHAADAAADFLARLREIHRSVPDDGTHYVVPVILDGENAWEHYPNNGKDFLKALYRGLTEADFIRPTTFSQYLQLEPHRESLPTFVAGSWIYGNLATWIGHPEKNRAWECLALARQVLAERAREEGDSAALAEAFRHILVAEGSDWFWWYGDDHQTQNAAEFDALFRNRIKSAYRVLGLKSPSNLDLPIKQARASTQFRNPTQTIHPVIDGKVTSYFEWLSAGFAAAGGGDAMHRLVRYLEMTFFGYDKEYFYLRVDFTEEARRRMTDATSVQLDLIGPLECRLLAGMEAPTQWQILEFQSPVEGAAASFAGDRILEAAVPLAALGIDGPDEVSFSVSIFEKGHEVERFPASGFITVPVDPWGLDHYEWMV